MKKRNAKVFALFMSVAMAMPNVAAAMPVYAAPEVEEAAAEEEEVEEVEEVEFDDVEVEEEAAAEEADVDSPVGLIDTEGDFGCDENGKANESIHYILKEGTLTLTAKTTCYMENFTKLEETPWADYADLIEKVVVTGKLQNIGDHAFENCKNITTVQLNDDIKKVGTSAFEGCSALTKVSYPSNDQAHTEEYGAYAFKDCTSLVSISFTYDLKKIDEFCFYNCKSLSFPNGLNFQSNLEVIERAAFWGCSSLEKLSLPASVKRIEGGFVGDEATATRLGLTKWYASAEKCSDENKLDGKLGAFAGCSKLSSVEFGINNDEGIDYIGEFAFYGCKGLATVNLPSTLGRIGGEDVLDADGNVVGFNADNYAIDKYAFEDCTAISTVTIANSRARELYGTFKRCEGIKEVTIGTYDEERDWYDTNIWSIDKETFANCTSLTKFTWNGSWAAYFGFLHNDYIGVSAFYNCKSLQEVELSRALGILDDRAFESCTSLKTINIPDGTTRIGKNAFFEDILLDDIYLPKTLTQIDTSAFSCNNADLDTMHLMDVYYSGTSDEWDAFVKAGIEDDNELLVYSGKNFNYKANKYPVTDLRFDAPTIKEVQYKNGGVEITWDKVTYVDPYDPTEKEWSPTTYYIYQNHITDKKVDEQWEQQTPLWTRVGSVSGSENSFVYSIEDTMKAGDVYSFRIRAEYKINDKTGDSKLSQYFTYTIPAAESDLVAVESLSFIQDNYTVDVDKAINVAAVIAPENASAVEYGWKVEDPSIAVAAVSEDKKSVTVTGKAEGHTTVTVSTPDGAKSASFEVYVTNPDDKKVEAIKFDTEKVTVAEGQPVKVSITITPEDAKASFEWESDNEKYATVKVADDEKSAIVTGLKEGTTEITVTANNGVTATIPVTITKKAEDDNTVSNIFDKDAAVKGVAVDASHTMTLSVNEEGNFTGAEIKGLDGKVDETMDSYIANIVTKRDKDGKPVEFYSLIFTDGKWDINYDTAKDGAYQFKGESYMVAGGVINQSANGLKYCGDKEGWKFLAAGRVVTDNAGLVEYDGEWFWIDDKGSCDDTYEAIVQWSGADFLVHGGRLRTDFTGFTYDPQNQTEWYHITKGQVWGNGEITDISIAGGEMTRMVLDGKVVK